MVSLFHRLNILKYNILCIFSKSNACCYFWGSLNINIMFVIDWYFFAMGDLVYINGFIEHT